MMKLKARSRSSCSSRWMRRSVYVVKPSLSQKLHQLAQETKLPK